jgi:hypothetical protein
MNTHAGRALHMPFPASPGHEPPIHHRARLAQRDHLFVHQAILSATALSLLEPQEFLVLPGSYNYPLHLHADFPPERAATSLNTLVTCRYDGWGFFQAPGWEKVMTIEEPLRGWLARQVAVRG